MRACELPMDIWVLLSDWAGNPALAAVNRLFRCHLRGRHVVAHVVLSDDMAALDAYLHRTVAQGARPCTSLVLQAYIPDDHTVESLVLPDNVGESLRNFDLNIMLPAESNQLAHEAVNEVAAWLPLSLETVSIRLVSHDQVCAEGEVLNYIFCD